MTPPSHIWINGAVVPATEARISPFDHGFLVGDGVFETLITRQGKPFTAVRHWQRLVKSCASIELAAPSFELFLSAIQDVLDASAMPESRIRVTVTSGDGPLGSDRGNSNVTMTVVASALKPWPPTETAVTVPWTRNECGALAGVKSTSYGENARALAYAHQQAAGEALLANTRGELCEGTGTNVFVVVDGVVNTPPLASGCLAGVTRALVIEACHAAEIPIRQDALPYSILKSCEEAFLTSSTRDVHPLARIDARVLPGSEGRLTRRVAEAFRAFIAGRDDP